MAPMDGFTQVKNKLPGGVTPKQWETFLRIWLGPGEPSIADAARKAKIKPETARAKLSRWRKQQAARKGGVKK